MRERDPDDSDRDLDKVPNPDLDIDSEIIYDTMRVSDCDEETAREFWKRFLGTVNKAAADLAEKKAEK